jgi:phage-related protein
MMTLAAKVYEAFKEDENKARVLADVIERIEIGMSDVDIVTSHDLTRTELTLIKEIEQNRANFAIEMEKVRNEIKETELKLVKEIEKVRNEIKETELKLVKEIEKGRSDLSIEIEKVRNEIKETELKLVKEIEKVRSDLTIEIEKVRGDVAQARSDLTIAIHSNNVSAIRWLVGLMITQLIAVSGLLVGLFQYFLK